MQPRYGVGSGAQGSAPPSPSQASSQQRQQDLNALQDYMQRCTNKLYWLDQQAKDRTHYDWSDHNLDYPSRRRQYEVGARLPLLPRFPHSVREHLETSRGQSSNARPCLPPEIKQRGNPAV